MGKLFPALLPEHEEFIRKQRLFFVGSAPLQADGHVNISPKGYDSLRIISPTEVAYLDLTGSGNETSAHVEENGRITFMFVAFEGAPMILRLYGRGRTILPGMPEWDGLAQRFDFNQLAGARQIIYAAVEAVKTSCGFSVPYYTYAGERDTLLQWALKKGEQGLAAYRKEKNAVSMDNIVTPLGRLLSESDGRPAKCRIFQYAATTSPYGEFLFVSLPTDRSEDNHRADECIPGLSRGIGTNGSSGASWSSRPWSRF